MQGPDSLPNELSAYGSASDDQALLHALTGQIAHLILYFEWACKDRAWAVQHQPFLRGVLRWTAKHYYLGSLSEIHARAVVKITQAHDDLLHPLLFFRSALFFTVKLSLDNQKILVNSLLFGVCCPALGKIFRTECFAKLRDELALPGIAIETFRRVESCVYQGKIAEFEKIGYGERKRLKQLGIEPVQELT